MDQGSLISPSWATSTDIPACVFEKVAEAFKREQPKTLSIWMSLPAYNNFKEAMRFHEATVAYKRALDSLGWWD